MIKIITTNKGYIWNYKKLLKNLAITVVISYLVVAYFYLSNQDYLTLINKL